MTTKYPSSLVLLELVEELAAKKCDLSLTCIRRDLNQLADDLTSCAGQLLQRAKEA